VVPPRFVAVAAALLLGGCTGTSIGNPPGVTQAQIQLGLQGQAGAQTMSGGFPDGGAGGAGGTGGAGSGGETHGGMVFDEAWLAFGPTTLLTGGQCGSPDVGAPDATGPFAAELVSGKVLPSRPSWSRPSGEAYCELLVKLEGAAPSVPGAPAGLTGATLLVTGHRVDGVPFQARVSVADDLVIRPKAGGTFTLGTGLVGMLLLFDFDDWIDPTKLAAAEVTNGAILVDASHNQAIAEDIENRLPFSTRLYRDDDRDGRYEDSDGQSELGE
jgi:hypothetical protein